MIISSCPLRISLVGGSTDHPEYLAKYEEGSVISFPCNLRVYVTVHKDIAGLNALKKKFVINYTKREEVDEVDDIQNDIVRQTLRFFNISEPLTISLTSDVSSVGSGLASSSAYIMALCNALFRLKKKQYTESEICAVAYNIEKTINPLVGQQDFWGSMSGGLKKINFFEKGLPTIEYLPAFALNDSMSLIHTGIYRNSKDVLSTINVDKCIWLMDDVLHLREALLNDNSKDVFSVIKRSWNNKKQTSNTICENPNIREIDEYLDKNPFIKAHKLCGAGNGGYFLTFGTIVSFKQSDRVTIPIKISLEGLRIHEIT